MSTLRDTKWIYNMTRATSDLSVPRPSVPRGFSPELLGVDGTTQGGLRPHNGFRLAHELDYYGITGNPANYSNARNLDARHRVIDFFPISFKKGFKTAYGFVYRVQYVNDGTPANDKSHVFIEYFDPDDNRWYSPKAPNTSITNTTQNLLMYDLSGELATADMDVQTFGRLVYVFVRGRSPSLFYIDLGSDNATGGTGTAADEIVVIGVTGDNSSTGNTGTPGPGQRPELVNFNEGQPLGELDTVTGATVPGTAQVVLADEAPSNIGLFGTTGIYTNSNNSFFTSPTSLSVPDANDSGDSGTSQTPQVSEPVTTLLDRRSVSSKSTFVPLDTSLSGDDRLLVLVNLDAGGDTGTYSNTIESIVFDNGRTATGGAANEGITLTEIDTEAAATTYQRIHAYEMKDATQSNMTSGATMNQTSFAGTINRSNCIVLTLAKAPLRGEILVYKVTGVPTGDESIVATSTSSTGTASSNTWGTSSFENPIYRSKLITYSTGGVSDLTFTFDDNGTTGFDFLTNDTQGPTDADSARIETLTAAFDADTTNVAGVAFLQFESDTAADYDLVSISSFSYTASNGLTTGVDAGYSFDDSISTINTTDGSSRRVVGTNGLGNKTAIAQQFQKTMNQSGSYVALDPFTSGSVVLVPIILKGFGGVNTGTGTNVNLTLVDAGSGGTLGVIDGVGGASNADATNTLGFSVGGGVTVNTFAFVYEYSNTKYQGFEYDLTTKLNRVADNGTGWNSNYLPQQITLALRPATSKVPTSFYTSYSAGSNKDFVDNCSISYVNPSPNVDGESTSPPEFTLSWRLNAGGIDVPLSEVVYDVYLTPDQGAPLAMVAESQPHNGSISKIQKYSIRRGSSPFRELFSKGRLDFGKTYKVKVVARLNKSTFNAPSDLGTKSPGKPGATVEFSTGIGDRTARRIKGGDYAFAYVLYDSKTGRKTSLSDVTSIDAEDFPQVTKFYDQATGNIVDDPTLCCADDQDPSGTECEFECEERLGGADQFVAMEVIYDSNKYDTAYFYRSVRTEDAGGTFTAGYLQLDKIVKLEDYETLDQPTSPTGYRRAVYFYTKEDKGLVWQPSYLGDSVLDEQMPYGGTATMYDNTMVVTSLNNQIASAPGLEEDRVFDEIRGIGEVRYSSLAEYSPELFPPLNRYAPSDPNNEILRLHKVVHTSSACLETVLPLP